MNRTHIAKKVKTSLVWACTILAPLPWGGVGGGLLTSCSDMMDIDDDRVAYDSQNRLDNPNDSIYSVMGVLAQLQQVADRNVVMGELRADLMTVDADYASTDLQDIANLQISATNAYAGAEDYYAIINNCNYILAHMDTAIVEGQTHVMLPEYAQVKVLRAYAYWQLALIYGQVSYYTQPLTDLSPVSARELSLDQLSLELIADLESVATARPLDYGTIDGWYSSELFLPAGMLLGDLYLYNNRYDDAAQAYYNLIVGRHLTVSSAYANTWQTTARQELNSGHIQAYRNEIITRQIFDSDLRSLHSQLRKLTYSDTPALLPATHFTSWMQQRTHFHTDNGQAISRYFQGDLRGMAELSTGKTRADAFGQITGLSSLTSHPSPLLITKFYNNLSGSETDELEQRPLTSLAVARPTTVYLRLAEAANRAGYPTAAFAVLKYGLSNQTLGDTLRVDSNEVKHLPAWLDFRASQFDQNIGTAARGMGLGLRWDREQYVIPEGVADVTDFVERAILDEMAAETCFEGNRFFDLLRISHHRTNHPALMAELASAKHADPEAMRQRMLQLQNWFVQKP